MNLKHTPRVWARTRTYEGKPCVRCGSTTRYIKTRNCVACAHLKARYRYAKVHGLVDESVSLHEWQWTKAGKTREELQAAQDAVIDAIPEDALPPINGHLGRAIAYAMIRQAVADLNSGDPDLAADAKDWLTSSSRRPFSLNFCCDVLGLERYHVEKAIMGRFIVSLPELAPEVIEANEHLVERTVADFVKHD